MVETINFLVRVWAEGYGEYRAEVFDSLGGVTARGIPIPDPLRITALRTKLATSPSETGVQVLGTLLFESLFTGELLLALRHAIDLAHSGGPLLRIQLAIEPNELSALPWELLFDPGMRQFLALSNAITLVRSLPSPLAQQFLPATKAPLRILGLFSSPRNMPPIDMDRERQSMEEALQPLVSRGDVELIVLEHATVESMVEALKERQCHILYYQGHVGFNLNSGTSYLLLEDRDGDAFVKGMYALSYTLDRTNVRLAVINSRGMAAGVLAYELVRYGIPAVVATQEPLADEETTTFLQNFSQALAGGQPVDAAVSQGRRAMWLRSGLQGRWASPMLVARANASLISLENKP